MRVCTQPGCPVLVEAGRCDAHRRDRDRRRGTRQERGYDADYDRKRAGFERAMAHGAVFTCWRPDCGRVILPHAWHLGHCDDDRSIIHGPECPACNLGARGDCPHPSHG